MISSSSSSSSRNSSSSSNMTNNTNINNPQAIPAGLLAVARRDGILRDLLALLNLTVICISVMFVLVCMRFCYLLLIHVINCLCFNLMVTSLPISSTSDRSYTAYPVFSGVAGITWLFLNAPSILL